MEHKAIAEALTLNQALKTYRQYVDDTHAQFKYQKQSHEFPKILNKQDEHIQLSIEDGNEEKCLNFFYIKIKNNNGKYEFDVHCKPSLKNVQIKLHSCIPAGIITSIFKRFIVRATKFCSEKYLKAEIEYLTDMFCENGHDRKILQKIINNFEKKTRSFNNNNNNNTDKKHTIIFPLIPKIGPKIKKAKTKVWI